MASSSTVRILVIGGTGFIGSHVVSELIRRGQEVAIYHRATPARALPRGVIEFHGDRRRLVDDGDRLRAFGPEIVIDLILSSGSQAQALMDVFRETARRVVVASSMDVYRACGVLHGLEDGPLEPLPLTEHSPLRTKLQTYPPAQMRMLQQVFGWLDDDYDKIPVERTVLADARLPATVLRLPMIYGPGDRLNRLFPLLKRMDDGRAAIILEERLAQWRSPRGYVENVATAIGIATLSDRASGRVYNVAEPETLTELEWAREVGAAAEWKGAIVTVPTDRTPPHLRMPGNLAQHWVPDTTRIRMDLGFDEPVSRPEALRRTIAWQRAHPPRIDPAQFDYAAEDAALVDRC